MIRERMLDNWYVRTALRAAIALAGCSMILATMLSFITSDQAWFDWVSVSPTLLLILGVWFGRDSLGHFLNGIEISVLRFLISKD